MWCLRTGSSVAAKHVLKVHATLVQPLLQAELCMGLTLRYKGLMLMSLWGS